MFASGQWGWNGSVKSQDGRMPLWRCCCSLFSFACIIYTRDNQFLSPANRKHIEMHIRSDLRKNLPAAFRSCSIFQWLLSAPLNWTQRGWMKAHKAPHKQNVDMILHFLKHSQQTPRESVKRARSWKCSITIWRLSGALYFTQGRESFVTRAKPLWPRS